MILDSWRNRSYYVNVHPLFGEAFTYIEECLKGTVTTGTYRIKGQDILAKVQEYKSRIEGQLEVHDKYIDIQFIVEGNERIEYVEREGLEMSVEYNEEDDVLFLKDTENIMNLFLKEGEFAVFFPSDAHKAAMSIDYPEKVKKIVLKVKI